jgi:hypothetical protein
MWRFLETESLRMGCGSTTSSREQTPNYGTETFDTDSKKEAQTQPQAGKVMLTILEDTRANSRTLPREWNESKRCPLQ